MKRKRKLTLMQRYARYILSICGRHDFTATIARLKNMRVTFTGKRERQ